MPTLPVSDKPFAWVDVETTGFNEYHHDIIEIAILREDPFQEIVYHQRIQIERPENAHPKALAVNKYSPETWADAPTVHEVFQEIHQRKLLQDCIVAGHNVSFDAKFINATFDRLGIQSRVDYHLYDTVTLALATIRPRLKSVSLVAVCEFLGIPTEQAHTALGDVHMAREVHRRLTQRILPESV